MESTYVWQETNHATTTTAECVRGWVRQRRSIGECETNASDAGCWIAMLEMETVNKRADKRVERAKKTERNKRKLKDEQKRGDSCRQRRAS